MKTKSFYTYIFLILFTFKSVMAYEEPNYKIVHQTKLYEIRSYGERIVVQTRFGTENSGFMKLFNYISGSNKNSEKIKMTTPVTLLNDGEKTVMQFYLPSEFEISNTPLPTDESIEISSIDAGYFAVIRYSGRTTDENFYKHTSILKNELEKGKIFIKSPPIKAIYDGPFTFPLFRRNEAMFLVEWN